MLNDREWNVDDQTARVRQRWLDKLWQYLFDGGSGGLMSPGQIQRERRDREQVRAMEMLSILEAEKDVQSIHRGKKRIDERGNLIDTPSVDHITTHSIIENTLIEQNQDVGLESSTEILKFAAKQLGVRDLERSLNLRKIAILCETEIWNSSLDMVSSQAIEADWIRRWHESSQDIFDAKLQQIWAKLLVQQLAQPDKYSIGVVSTLTQLNARDMEIIGIASKYLITDFIYDASGRYFTESSHKQLFELLIDYGLIIDADFNADATQQIKVFPSETSSHFTLLFSCHDKALSISSDDPVQTLKLPIYKTTRLGRQVLSLCGNDADLAYLFDLANYIKEQGFNVVLGDWKKNSSLTEEFVEKMVI
jgi:hypothetical protein